MMTTELDVVVLDDKGLRGLLKLPAEADLDYYRQRAGLPYVTFKVKGKIIFRYVTTEVLNWLTKRQRHGDDS